MKILNLYACLGGNRYKWNEVADVDVTAVEWDEELAKLYQQRFPDDKVIIDDAHQYLLNHYREYDFIWSSPPCPTHSRSRFWGIGRNGKNPVYPDMTLYQEIIFLKHHCDCKWVVENVKPYYDPLIPAEKRGRHLYWANFKIPNTISHRVKDEVQRGKDEVKKLCVFHNFDFYKYKGKQRINKIARNLVDYEAGKTLLEVAIGIIRKQNTQQTTIFDKN
tara:strand:+ start:3887 stop:4543 length:657 start_codon:yes stop_codon:yes gene_type:complete